MTSENSSNRFSSANLDSTRFYWAMVGLIVVCGLGSLAGRIMQCESTRNGNAVPFLSANDRSRWCTVRALVDHGTYAIDEVIESEGGEDWNTIDKVYHQGPEGEFRFYSSKPTLLPTLVAGKYWLLKSLTGKSIAEHPFFVIRWLLFLTNGIAFTILILSIARIASCLTDQLGPALFVVVASAFGTHLTPFAITFSNHLPAASLVSLTLALLIPMWQEPDRKRMAFWKFPLIGLACSLVAAFELPGLSFTASILALCAIKSFSRTLLGVVPSVLLVVVAFFGTNHIAHGTWKPAYAHRDDGPVLQTIDGDFAEALNAGKLPAELRTQIDRELNLLPTVTRGNWPGHKENRWLIDLGRTTQLVIAQVKNVSDGSDLQKFEVREVGNWYEYENSYWLSSNPNKAAVDRGEPDSWKYLAHATIGHHGVFSLSPIWILGILGMFWLVVSRSESIQLPALAFLAITVVVFAFYVFRVPAHDRNYGGWSCCFRWAIWMYPMWLTAMIPVVAALWNHRLTRWLLFGLLLISVCSAWSANANPWTHPWLQEWLLKS